MPLVVGFIGIRLLLTIILLDFFTEFKYHLNKHISFFNLTDIYD